MSAPTTSPSRHAPALKAVKVVVAVMAVLAVLVPLIAIPAVSTAAASTAAITAPALGAQPRQAREDFPRLAPQCYDADDVITSPCRITRFPGRPLVILWGDSHAQMYLPAIRQIARNRRVNLITVLFGGCPVSTPFAPSRRYPRTGCDQHNVDSLAYVRTLTRGRTDVRIILNGFWSGYRHAYELVQKERRTGVPSGLSSYRKHMAALGVERTRSMVRQIGRLGVPVDLIGQSATVPLDPRTCLAGREPYQCDLPRHRALYKERDNKRWVRTVIGDAIPGPQRLIDPSPTYCGPRTCVARVRGANTFYDDIHLSATLTSTMAPYFRPVFADVLAR